MPSGSSRRSVSINLETNDRDMRCPPACPGGRLTFFAPQGVHAMFSRLKVRLRPGQARRHLLKNLGKSGWEGLECANLLCILVYSIGQDCANAGLMRYDGAEA
jgi:hypothetical protein